MPEAPSNAHSGHRRGRPRHWLVWLPLLLLLCVSLLVARHLLDPSVQREFLLRKASPLVDSLTLDYVRLTPFSLVVRGADIVYQGGRYHVGNLEAGFNPLALLNDTVSITRLHLQHTDLDLRQLTSAPPTSEPFPGLLPTLDHGYAIALKNVDVAVSVLLKGEHGLTIRLAGDGFKPHVAGSLDVSLAYAAPTGPDRIEAEGVLTLSQLSGGRIRALSAVLTTDFALAALPATEQVRFSITLAPPPGLQGNPYRRRFRTLPDGSQRVVPNPEAITFEAVLGDRETPDRARLTIDGLYRGEDGVFSAGYRLLAGTTLLAPYVDDAPLPELTSETRGALQVETLHGSGLLTMETETALSALERVLGVQHTLPQRMVLRGAGSGTFDPEGVDIAAFRLTLADEAPHTRLALELTAPLRVPFAAPLSILTAPRPLAEIHLGPLPLSWLDGFVPDHQFEGALTGHYAVVVDEEARIKLNPLETTELHDVRITRDTEVLADQLDLSVLPTASWSADFIRGALNELEVQAASKSLAKLNIKIASKQGADPREWRYRAQGRLDFDVLRGIPVAAAALESYTLPPELSVRFKSLIGQRAQSMSIETLELEVGAPSRPNLLTLNGLQPFHLQMGPDGLAFEDPRGDIATAVVNGLDLRWLNPFLPALTVEGRIAAAAITLRAPASKTLAVEASSPLLVENLSVMQGGEPWLRELTIVTTPSVDYSADRLALDFANTALSAGGQRLLSGDARIALREFGTPAVRFSMDSTMVVDINALAAQPVIAAALPRALPALPINGELTVALEGTPQVITVSQAQADVKLGERATLAMRVEPGLVIKTTVAADENLAQHVVGALAIDINNLPSSTVHQFVPLDNLSFAEINASLRLRSNGNVLRATSLAPLSVEDVRITDGTRVMFNPFNLQTTANLRIEQRRVRGTFEQTALTFTGHTGRAALAGDIQIEIEPGRQMPLTLLDATLTADLPQLLAQPAVMPGHTLTGGILSFEASIDADRQLTANLLLDQLAAGEPMAIQTFELPITGEMAADGRGFDFTAPLVGRGRSGPTNATVVGHFAPQPDEPRVLRLDIKSEVFYLNDILASLAAIHPQLAVAPDDPEKVRIALDETPDEKAAWKLIVYAVVIDLAIDKLFYSDYLAFTDVNGELDLRSRKFALSGIKARFHDSVITFDGAARFKAGTQDPYDLQIAGKVADFDLNEFFTALLPDERSRVEGLFGVDFRAFGQFPNFSQLRNRILFDIKMQSREGLFRPLPPDSGLLLGASDFLGLVGEGLSYVPTGGFGVGAVARLVNYIASIDYDTIDIHLVRDASRDVRVEQFLVLSPTIALTVTGGIQYVAGRDILDSPLELNGNLDMLGRGAAILYSMDLMRDRRNDFGYWRGPEFRIWGTLAEPQSNFEEIVQQAGDGTIKGSILRPISGLIGNLKYRWFNDDSEVNEAAEARLRALEEENAPAPEPSVAAPGDR